MPIIFGSTEQRFDAPFSHYQQTILIKDMDPYMGSYTITPSVEPQILATANKSMSKNMNIKAIPYYETGNAQNGKTVYIGTEMELYGD